MILTINVPDAVAPTVLDNICAATNYDPASGKTKGAWVKEQVIRTLKLQAANGAAKRALEAANGEFDAAAIG